MSLIKLLTLLALTSFTITPFLGAMNGTLFKQTEVVNWQKHLKKANPKLLTTKFDDWGTSTLLAIAQTLTKSNGYRTKRVHRRLRPFTNKERTEELPKIFAQHEEVTFDHIADHFPNKVIYSHPDHETAQDHWSFIFAKARGIYQISSIINGRDNQLDMIAELIGKLTFHLIRLRPYKERHKLLGYILANVILTQLGYPEVPTYERAPYIKAICSCLSKESSRPLVIYWRGILQRTKKYKEQLLLEADEEFIALVKELTTLKLDESTPPPKPKRCPLAIQLPLISPPLLNGTTKACASCKTIKSTDKLKRCSICKQAYYCNAFCQRSDWKNHKKDCHA